MRSHNIGRALIGRALSLAYLSAICWFCFSVAAFAESVRLLEGKLCHLRMEGPREWHDFPETPESKSLILNFEAKENSQPWAIQLRQQDVKETWTVCLNEVQLGKLSADEQDMIRYFSVPGKCLHTGQNELKIEQVISKRSKPDDIRVGEISLHRRSLQNLLSESSIDVAVVDAETNLPIPCRVTIVRTDGSMQTLGTTSSEHLAVRPGTVYTSTGNAQITLPTGNYLVYAGRGFEYSVDRTALKLHPGETVQIELAISREVATPGYVSCDTHVHTFTYSKHGDSSIQERMVTLAGEGIEFPIATDHNSHVDYEPFALEANVRQYFTPVIGNEVTTKLGHFNVFPVEKNSKPPDHRLESWDEIFQEIKDTQNVRVIILNHARDVHSGMRPFGPKWYNSAVGDNLQNWKLQANAMEVINSGATQTETHRLFHDWMTQLNRGNELTPVGCSDSHTVSRYIVGQGRTYIRCDDRDPGNIDQGIAIQNFLDGQVLVSYGLITEMKVNGKYQSGELAFVSEGETEITVDLRVLGPHWVNASRIQLYANGQLIREETIEQSKSDNELPSQRGVKWSNRWTIKLPRHDVHLVAIATGPGIQEPYWRTAKPYQPTSTHFQSQVLGCSGAIWIDADRDQVKTSAFDYATQLYSKRKGDLNQLLSDLKEYDAAVAAQVAHRYQASGKSILADECQTALKKASAATQQGFRRYLNAWRETIVTPGEN